MQTARQLHCNKISKYTLQSNGGGGVVGEGNEEEAFHL